jgi:hypothetical protein
LSDLPEDCTWLYRGVPAESAEVNEVAHFDEIRPPRPDRIGDQWRRWHSAGMTETGYTSWTTNRSLAEDAARAGTEELSGQTKIFRVRIDKLDPEQLYEGRADEDEYLIEGTVENVEFCEGPTDDEENA